MPSPEDFELMEIFEQDGAFFFYAQDAEPFKSSPEGREGRYLVGPFATREAAEDY